MIFPLKNTKFFIKAFNIYQFNIEIVKFTIFFSWLNLKN
jgi:hypothetical protein